MAEKGKTSYTGRLKADIKKHERIKIDLEEKIKQLEEERKDHDENCQTKIHDLKEEIKILKEEIEELKKKMGDLQNSNTFLKKEANEAKKEIEKLKTELGKLNEKIKKFELSEEELVIRQLCSSVQENLLKIVLQEHFDKFQNKRTEDMENYILWQIEDEDEQNKARLRWEELKKETKWDEFLLKQLKLVKKSGNETAHPPLTEDIIDDAKNKLEKRGMLRTYMVKAVDQLKDIWGKTNQKLTPSTSATEGHDPCRPISLSTTGQINHKYIKVAGKRGYSFSSEKASGGQSFSQRYIYDELETF